MYSFFDNLKLKLFIREESMKTSIKEQKRVLVIICLVFALFSMFFSASILAAKYDVDYESYYEIIIKNALFSMFIGLGIVGTTLTYAATGSYKLANNSSFKHHLYVNHGAMFSNKDNKASIEITESSNKNEKPSTCWLHEIVSATNELGYDVSHSEELRRGKKTTASWTQTNGKLYGYVFTAYKSPTSTNRAKVAFKVKGTIYYDK